MYEDYKDEEAMIDQQSLGIGVIEQLEHRILELDTETASLKQEVRRSRSYTSQQQQLNMRQETRRQTKENRSEENRSRSMMGWRSTLSNKLTVVCWWCQRRGHREADCDAKRKYQ